MDSWTLEMVEERLVEAASVMRRTTARARARLLQYVAAGARGVRRSRRSAARAHAAAAAVAGRDQPDGGGADLVAVA